MSGPMDPIRDYFDTEARRYARERYDGSSCDQFAYQARRRLALEMLGAGHGRVLDIGSGPGVLTTELRRNGYHVYSLDVSIEMLRESRCGQTVRPAGPHFTQGRLPELPFVAGSFDAAMAIGVLAYLDDPLAGLTEIRRVLRTDGVAVLQASNAACPTSRLHSFLRRWYRRSAQLIGGPAYPHLAFPLKQFRLGTLRTSLREASLQIEGVAFYDFRPPFLQWIAPDAALAAARRLQRLEYSNAIRLFAEGMMLKVRAS
jgi:ubiquinone/menaquinone biosynthesis C-methylase UbiE